MRRFVQTFDWCCVFCFIEGKLKLTVTTTRVGKQKQSDNWTRLCDSEADKKKINNASLHQEGAAWP